MVALAVQGEWLDSIVPESFPNSNDSMIAVGVGGDTSAGQSPQPLSRLCVTLM